jgi:hypothetical protein
MALTLPKLTIPKLSLDNKQLPFVVGGVVVLAAAGWFGWQYFAGEPPPPTPISKPQPVTAAKPQAKGPSPAEIEKARDKLIEDVLVASGLKQKLDQLPQQFIADARLSARKRSKGSSAEDKPYEAVVTELFTAQGFNNRMKADLKKNFDEKRLQALLKDYSAPAAKQMVELGRVEPNAAALAKFVRSPAAKRPSSERATLIKRIDAASGASDLAVDIAFTTMKAIALGMAGEGAKKAALIEKGVEKERASSEKKIRDASLLNLAFGLKDASDADLEAYAKFYETENSKWLTGIAQASILDEVKSASTQAGERFGMLPGIAPAAKHTGSKAGADARACLSLATNAAIIECAEAYR